MSKEDNTIKVKRGKWKTRAVPFCSICGEEAISVDTDTGGAWIMTPYCPWCGAEMEDRKDGEVH